MRLRSRLLVPGLDVPAGSGRLKAILPRTEGPCVLLVDAGDAGPAALLVPPEVVARLVDRLRRGIPEIAFRGRIVGTIPDHGPIPAVDTQGDVRWVE